MLKGYFKLFSLSRQYNIATHFIWIYFKQPSSIVEAPGSPLGNMLRHDAAVAGQRARRPKEQQKPTQDYNYQPAYYDDPAPPNNVEYDSLNYLLRNSEERASRDLFQVAAQRGTATILL